MDILDYMTLHTKFMCNIANKINAKTILEIGVRDGVSTKAWLRNTTAHLISIDIDNCSQVFQSKRWTFIQADSTRIELYKPIDILLIDSSHLYRETLIELDKYSPLVKCKGYIFLHDIYQDGINKSKIKRMLERKVNWETFVMYAKCIPKRRPGVYKAIKKWLQDNPDWMYTQREIPNDRCGLGILQRKKWLA